MQIDAISNERGAPSLCRVRLTVVQLSPWNLFLSYNQGVQLPYRGSAASSVESLCESCDVASVAGVVALVCVHTGLR